MDFYHCVLLPKHPVTLLIAFLLGIILPHPRFQSSTFKKDGHSGVSVLSSCAIQVVLPNACDSFAASRSPGQQSHQSESRGHAAHSLLLKTRQARLFHFIFEGGQEPRNLHCHQILTLSRWAFLLEQVDRLSILAHQPLSACEPAFLHATPARLTHTLTHGYAYHQQPG